MKKICTLALALLGSFALSLPAFAASWETISLKDSVNNVAYTLTYEKNFSTLSGYSCTATIENASITAQKGAAPGGSFTRKVKIYNKSDPYIVIKNFSDDRAAEDTDCTKSYTAIYTCGKSSSWAQEEKTTITLTRAATSGHTEDNNWRFDAATEGGERTHSCGCSHPVCTQRITCDKIGHYVSNGNGTHTFTCAGGHTITENCSGGTATCTQKAVCQYCSTEYGTTDANNHNFSVESKTADGALKTAGDCLHEAVYYKSCSRCGAVSTSDNDTFEGDKDEDNHVDLLGTDWKTDDANTKHWLEYPCCYAHVSEAEHSSTGANVATCTAQAVCDTCHLEYGDTLPHSYTREDANESALVSAATCTEAAVYYKACADCPAVSTTDTFTYGEPLGHGDWEEGTYSVITEPTCGVDGVATGVCGRCRETITDIVLPATGEHTWDEGSVTRKATTTAEGEMTYTCTVCGAAKTEAIAKIASTVTKHAPQTGDESHLAAWTGTLLLACGAALLLSRRKAKNG